jgi:hypothetical protein
VFEKVYWKASSASVWTLLETTAPHTIVGSTSEDAQFIDIAGASHGLYDFKIEIYRSGQASPDATRDDSNDAVLNDVALENDEPQGVASLSHVWMSNEVDADLDGYKEAARLNWDADVISGSSLMVVDKVYWRFPGDLTWHPMLTTTAHSISGVSSADAQYLDLSSATRALYDLKIEVYRAGQDTPDATVDDATDPHLREYALEPVEATALATISSAWWSNAYDVDADGFPQTARLNWDPDVSGSTGSLNVFERVYWRVSGGGSWSLIATTADHTISGASTSDAQYVDVQGGSHGLYDFKIEVYRSGQSGPDATRSEADDANLRGYPMETGPEDTPNLPLITDITPSIASAGTDTPVTISGSGFGATQGSGIVGFEYKPGVSPIAASIVSWTDTQIVCTVPVGSVFGYLASASSGAVTVMTADGTSNEFVFKVTFGYLGRWSTSLAPPVIGYHVNEDTTDCIGEGAAVQRAAATWTTAGANFVFKYLGPTTATTSTWDGDNEILWMSLDDPSTIAETTIWSDDTGAIEADITFNTSFKWSTSATPPSDAMDVETLALHELGHVIGLRDLYGDIGDDEYDVAKVMYGYKTNGASQRTLHADDVAGSRWIYGPAALRAVVSEAWWSEELDSDGDGYKRTARLNWDTDVGGGTGSLAVTEKIYWKATGDTTWTLLTTTATHTVTNAVVDSWSVDCGGRSHGEYDWKIEVYREGTPTPNDTRDPSNDTDLSAYKMELPAEDGAPTISVTPPSQDFGAITVGTTSDRALTVQNVGGGTLDGIASVPEPFSVVSGGSFSLTAGQSQAVIVRYSPLVATTVPDTGSVVFTGGGGASRAVSGSAVARVPPTVTTGSASGVGQSGATLNGTVTPNGTATTAYFEYGLTTNYGSQTPNQNMGSGATPAAVSAGVTGLTCGTPYHFRLVGTNTAGTVPGADQVLTTTACSPTVVTGNATGVGQSGATLNGTVTPNGTATTAHFEYGPTTSYGSQTSSQNVGSGTTPVPVSAGVTGLTCGIPYHFRLVGATTGGTVGAGDQTFTCLPTTQQVMAKPAGQTGVALARVGRESQWSPAAGIASRRPSAGQLFVGFASPRQNPPSDARIAISRDPVVMQAMWQSTGVIVHAGDVVTISVAPGSTWQNETRVLTADGDTADVVNGPNAPMPGQPRLALVGRIGPTGLPFCVGTQVRFTATQNDLLYLAPNDDWYTLWDNDGSLTVSVCVAPSAAVPTTASLGTPAAFAGTPTPAGRTGTVTSAWVPPNGGARVVEAATPHGYATTSTFARTLTALVGDSALVRTGSTAVTESGRSDTTVAAKPAEQAEVDPVQGMWQSTGVTVHAGDVVTISVAPGATWQNGARVLTADGDAADVVNGSNCPMPGQPRLALVGRIGPTGLPFRVGTQAQFTATQDDLLYLAPNDEWYLLWDNGGRLTVSISIRK